MIVKRQVEYSSFTRGISKAAKNKEVQSEFQRSLRNLTHKQPSFPVDAVNSKPGIISKVKNSILSFLHKDPTKPTITDKINPKFRPKKSGNINDQYKAPKSIIDRVKPRPSINDRFKANTQPSNIKPEINNSLPTVFNTPVKPVNKIVDRRSISKSATVASMINDYIQNKRYKAVKQYSEDDEKSHTGRNILLGLGATTAAFAGARCGMLGTGMKVRTNQLYGKAGAALDSKNMVKSAATKLGEVEAKNKNIDLKSEEGKQFLNDAVSRITERYTKK